MRATTMWLAAGALLAGAAQAQTLPGTAPVDPGKTVQPAMPSPGMAEIHNVRMGYADFVRCTGYMERTVSAAMMRDATSKKALADRLEAVRCSAQAMEQLKGTPTGEEWYRVVQLFNVARETKSASSYMPFIMANQEFLIYHKDDF